MEDKRENGGSPEQDKEPEREFRGLYKYVKISERSLNWIIIVLGAALVICFGIGYANRGYMVDFDARGGTVVESQKRMYGDLVTVPEELLPVYEGFFRRFGFCLSGSYVGLYRVGKREFFFNGTLT